MSKSKRKVAPPFVGEIDRVKQALAATSNPRKLEALRHRLEELEPGEVKVAMAKQVQQEQQRLEAQEERRKTNRAERKQARYEAKQAKRKESEERRFVKPKPKNAQNSIVGHPAFQSLTGHRSNIPLIISLTPRTRMSMLQFMKPKPQVKPIPVEQSLPELYGAGKQEQISEMAKAVSLPANVLIVEKQ